MYNTCHYTKEINYITKLNCYIFIYKEYRVKLMLKGDFQLMKQAMNHQGVYK